MFVPGYTLPLPLEFSRVLLVKHFCRLVRFPVFSQADSCGQHEINETVHGCFGTVGFIRQRVMTAHNVVQSGGRFEWDASGPALLQKTGQGGRLWKTFG